MQQVKCQLKIAVTTAETFEGATFCFGRCPGGRWFIFTPSKMICTAKSRIHARGRTDFWGGGAHFVTDNGDQGINDLFPPLLLGRGAMFCVTYKRHICIVFTDTLHSPLYLMWYITYVWDDFIYRHIFYVNQIKLWHDIAICYEIVRARSEVICP